jgi:hypothetical protein
MGTYGASYPMIACNWPWTVVSSGDFGPRLWLQRATVVHPQCGLRGTTKNHLGGARQRPLVYLHTPDAQTRLRDAQAKLESVDADEIPQRCTRKACLELAS